MEKLLELFSDEIGGKTFRRHYAETKSCSCCVYEKKKVKELKAKGVKL